jgi:hypothetical protein
MRPLFLLLFLVLTFKMLARRAKRTPLPAVKAQATIVPPAIKLEKKTAKKNSLRTQLRKYRTLLTFTGYALFLATFLVKDHYAETARGLRDALENASTIFLTSQRLDLLAERTRTLVQWASQSAESATQDPNSREIASNRLREARDGLADAKMEFASVELLDRVEGQTKPVNEGDSDLGGHATKRSFEEAFQPWLWETDSKISDLSLDYWKIENPGYDEAGLATPPKTYDQIASEAEHIVSQIRGGYSDIHGTGEGLLRSAHDSYISADRDEQKFKALSFWLFLGAFILAFVGAIFQIDGIVPLG